MDTSADIFRPVSPPFPRTVPDESAYFLPVREGELLVRASSNSVMLCQSWPKALERPETQILVGWINDRPCLLAELPPGKAQKPPGHAFRDLRSLHGLLEDAEYAAAGTGMAALHFLRTSAFCPRCGKEAQWTREHWLRRCGACGLEQEPRTHPTVIGLLYDGLQMLLVQPVGFSSEMFTLPAVPVGPGQSLEEALRHHARETLGVQVGELTYFGSQPWPYPDRVVIGFHGAVEVQRPVPFDRRNFSAARFFHIDDLPPLPPPLSMARRLADWYAQLPRIQGRPSIPKH